MKIAVPLVDGFEEIEAVSIIDVLRRASIETTTLYVSKNPVKGSHDIIIQADVPFKDAEPDNFDAVVVPGGMPGSTNLRDNSDVISFIQDVYSRGGYAAAICAAPIVLARAELLQGKKYTCAPGFEKEITGAIYQTDPVVADGKIITARGASCAIPFALKLVEILDDPQKAETLKNSMQTYWM